MKVLYSWLEDFVELDLHPEELAQKLIMTGLEVTQLEKVEDDWVIELEVTPNRPDCLSILGIARECAIALNKKLRAPKIPYLPRTSSAYIRENEFQITIEEREACPRYIGRVLLNLQVRESPEFIKQRLEKLGFRAINNVVDITNYVLLELGQPLHAFDYDKIEGKRIVVRLARQGERILTLDGEERQLSLEDLVIADAERPIALAGIMGGKETEVGFETQKVLLESAYFAPLVVRKSSQRHALVTESSYRFERGVDFPTLDVASKYAVELFRKYASREKRKSSLKIDKCIDLIKKQVPFSSKVDLKFSEIEKTLGVMPSTFWIRRLFQNLGAEILSVSKTGMKLQGPSYRQDLKESIDYIEEIARFYGYQRIPEQELPHLSVEKEPELEKFGDKKFEDKVRDLLIRLGLNEVISYVFLSQEEVKRFQLEEPLPLLNPLSKSYSVLRPSLIPSLLRIAQYNFNRNCSQLSIFELGKVYGFRESPWERKVLGILLTGTKYEDYFGNQIAYTFYDLKGLIENFLRFFGIKEYDFREVEGALFSSDCSLSLQMQGKRAGSLGKISEELKEHYRLKAEIYAGELFLDAVRENLSEEKFYQELPQYPFISRDISLLLPRLAPAGKVLSLLEGRHPWIQEVSLIDLYQGDQIPPERKSITVRIKFQSYQRTLKDEEVDEIVRELEQILLRELPCQIRK